ncbi:hypothetical protein Rsub_00946 [Raphidocelis subcapitata]|uniref:FAD dependent oxidoreductase domain-containing protein n=1 Tax=Raphidocelis subcapitata TaxID=307507 RepID=A0A2V0NLE5_9CHLO|nr:hypothetical protein Rsub_00946 [Raphidocelis subcapitata]|eukprot:GBF88234.1 hypothetical protein Rsub_00946 [Raphidocelis subcapitata]
MRHASPPGSHKATTKPPQTRLRARTTATSAGDGAAAPPKRVVICGGGIVGAATAYYLATRKGVAPTLVERHEVAGAASGRAGGFLALDWNDSTPVGKLARKSYELHKELAAAFGAEAIGYRPLDTLSVSAAAAAAAAPGAARARARLDAPLPPWLDGAGVLRSGALGGRGTTAQVHPQKLTRALWGAAEAAGARLVRGAVKGVALDAARQVTGVEVEGAGTLPADAVLIAMGPWSGQAAAWLAACPAVGGQKAHSCVLRPASTAAAAAAAPAAGAGAGGGGVWSHAVFVSYRDASGETREPEIYPRPDGSCYVCGENSDAPLPDDPAAVAPDSDAAISRIREVAGALASELKTAELEAASACYLPITSDGLPFIGRVPGVRGAFIGAGHSCWGILNGPATGLALAELIADGAAASVNLAPFDPARGAGRHQYGAI